MAKKRFTDIEIWDKEWFMQLTPTMKCLMKYLHDKCDASGCWKPNWKLASVHINEEVAASDLQNLPADQYEILKNGKIFIPDFIKFQYGTLSDKSPAHKPIFTAIEKNNLSDRVFNRVSHTLQEKEMDKEEEKDKDKEEEKDSGKILNENLLVPEMFSIFKKELPNYPSYVDKDLKPILSIANFLHKQSGLNGNVVTNQKVIIQEWTKMCKIISGDKFYNTKTLSTISNQIQEIYQITKNGRKISSNVTNRNSTTTLHTGDVAPGTFGKL